MNGLVGCFRAIGLAACLVIFAVLGSGPAQAAVPLEHVTLQLKWKHQFEYAGYYAAAAQGYYAAEGLDVQIKAIGSGVSPIASVLDATANYGIWPSGLVLERMRGKPVILLANDLKTSPLVLLAGAAYTDPGQLRGRKVMGARDESENAEIVFMLKASGIEAAELDWVDHTFNVQDVIENRAAAMTAYLTNQPYALVEKGVPHTIFNPHDYGIDFYGNILFTSEREAEENPERTRRFVRASKKGWQYALAHPEEIADLILARYSTEKSRDALLFEAREIKKIMESADCPLGSIDPHRLEYIAKMFVALGMARSDYDLAGLIFGGPEAICNESQVLLNSEELFYLKKHPLIRVPNMLAEPPYDFNENGQPSGIAIDFMNLIGAKAGLGVQYVTGPSRSEFVGLLERDEIDLLLSISRTPDLEGKYLFSDSYRQDTPVIYAHENSVGINSLADLAGKTLAVPEGWYGERLLRLYYPQIKRLSTTNLLAAIQAVTTGRADVVVADQTEVDFLVRRQRIHSLVLAAPVADKRFMVAMHLGFRPEDGLLRDILNKAVKAVTAEEKLAIQQKWLREAQKPETAQTALALSPAESAYLAGRGPVNMCVDPDWLPFEEIDANGVHIGVAADFMGVLARRLGMTLRLVPTDSWPQSLDLARTGDCDILSMVNRTPARAEYLGFTDPYLVTPMVIVVRQEEPFLKGLADLQGKTLATVRGYQIEELVQRDYPGIKLVFEDSIDEVLLAVSKGKAYATIGSILSLGSNIQELRLTNLKIAGHAPYSNRFSVGVNKDDPQLLALFQKAVASLLPAEKDEIINRWVDLRITREVDTSLFWKALIVLGGGLLLLVARQVMLTRVNARLQKAHKAVRLEKERAERALQAEQEAINRNVRFVDMVGHEYRTPVSIISANLDILEMKDEQAGGPSSPQVVKMRYAVRRLVELIETSLDKVRLTDASITLTRKTVDLAAVLTAAMDQVGESHPARQFVFDQRPTSPCLVWADYELLQTAFVNLLDNARKYSGADSRVEIRLLPGQEFFEVEVLDRGLGIPWAEQDQICEKYCRATNASHVGGAGIGLYLVRKIIHLHAGSLQLAPRQGGGTKVTVRLPVAGEAGFL
jgi:polar amino acid transport system substrate-binding protein